MTKKQSILKNLNPKQVEAVKHIDGPLLIIAGPGSGKTRTITHRVAYLVAKGISPARILGVTFTNKAAEEMQNRVSKLLGGNPKSDLPYISTFHSFCARLLRRHGEAIGVSKNYVIYDAKDSLKVVEKVMETFGIDKHDLHPNFVKKRIEFAKNELLSAQAFKKQRTDYPDSKIAPLYEAYQKKLVKNNALDFGDLIRKAVALFEKNPSILETYQQQYRYLMVDEYQDTNQAQYQLSWLLAKKYKNIAVVGDDAQSIYGFRGADYRNILRFEKDWPQAKVVMLEQNYRSTQNILDAAGCIISKNLNQKQKKLWTDKSSGPQVRVQEVPDEKEEARFVASEIERLASENNLKLNDFAVLFRTNAQSRALEEEFIKQNFPYRLVGSVRFYERREIKDILAYLRLLNNPEDTLSLERIYNVPPRGIGKKTWSQLGSVLQEKIKAIPKAKQCPKISRSQASARALQAVNDFLRLVYEFYKTRQELSLTKLIRFILREIDYKSYLSDRTEESDQRWENIQELLTVASRYDRMKQEDALKSFLEEVALLSQEDEVETDKELINLMTLHAAKGTEFPCVFIVGCEEGLFPHSKSFLDPSQMAEERRLCYVGVTRAKKWVYLVYAQKRRVYGRRLRNPRSRFIDDIDKELVEFNNY